MSECLRDLLQAVLKDVCGIALDEDRLSVSRITLTSSKQLLTWNKTEQSAFQALLQKYGVCHSLTDFYPVGNTNPARPEPGELFIDLDLVDGYLYQWAGRVDSVIGQLGW